MRPLLGLSLALSFVFAGAVVMVGGLGFSWGTLLAVAGTTAALAGVALGGAARLDQSVALQVRDPAPAFLRGLKGFAAGSLLVALGALVFAFGFSGLDGLSTPSVLSLGVVAAMGLGGTFGLSIAAALANRLGWAAPAWLAAGVLVVFGMRAGVVGDHVQRVGTHNGHPPSNFLETPAK